MILEKIVSSYIELILNLDAQHNENVGHLLNFLQ